jgi:hypothetical protein
MFSQVFKNNYSLGAGSHIHLIDKQENIAMGKHSSLFPPSATQNPKVLRHQDLVVANEKEISIFLLSDYD